VKRGELYWADLGPPAGRRPVCVLTRDGAVDVLNAVVCAPLTRTIRKLDSEVLVGTDEGLPETSVIACDNILTVPKVQFDPDPVGVLGTVARAQLDQALRYALDIRY
jgi:mRNA interferase MazF